MTATTELVERVTTEQGLLLRAALLEDGRANEAWQEWRGAVEFDKVDEPSQRLLPLCARRMDDVAPDEELRGLIRGLYRHAWGRNHLLWRDVKPVYSRLRARGIPVVLLKGLALLRAYGGDWGARPMYDIDLLVPRDRAAHALEVLGDLGWEPEDGATFDWVRARAIPHRHSWGFCRDDGRVDLHWRVLLGSLGVRADDGFWRAAEPVDVGGLQLAALAPADLLLHVLLHGTSFGDEPLQWIADAVLTARWAGPALVRHRLAAQARRHGEVEAVHAGLEAVAELVDEADVAPFLDELTRVRPGRIERAAFRRAGKPGGVILRQLAHHADEESGMVRGAASLAADRLDLTLARRPWATVLHAAAGRSTAAGRVLRRVAGMSSRTAVEGEPIDDGDELPLSYRPLVDQYCGPGWSYVWPEGVVTHGDEARLVIPLGYSLRDADVVATFEIRALTGHRRFDIVVNESHLARATAGPLPTRISVLIDASVAGRFHPVEVALRTPAGDRLRGRSFLDFQLCSIRFDRAEPAPKIDIEFW